VTVDGDWKQIMTWLRVNAPRSAERLRPAQALEEQQAIAAMFTERWPADLAEWYSLQDGADPLDPQLELPPGWVPSPLRKIRNDTEMFRKIARDLADEYDADKDLARAGTEPAGSVSWFPLDAWVFIANDVCGNYLFVDLRQGPNYGCLSAWVHGDANLSGILWPSVAAMLQELATALQNGTPIEGSLPLAQDGVLTWRGLDP
jgi:cell wall assembly regulator SMI1